MSYNSKYTGEEIEGILDKVNSGNIDTYNLNISVENLISNIKTGAKIPVNQDFINAIQNNNRISIPYDNTRNNLGYYTITGHVEGYTSSNIYLNFTLPINNNRVIYCVNCPIIITAPSIDPKYLYLSDANSFQEKLVSGKNISTINGKSLLDGGDIILGQSITGITPTGTPRKTATFALGWGKVHIIEDYIYNLNITMRILPKTNYDEATVIFALSDLGGTFTLPSNIDWANGIDPTTSLEPYVLYELSISYINIGGEAKYNGILVPFKK